VLAGTTILLIRHGEKTGNPCKDGDGDPGLSPYGQERATLYVQFFDALWLSTSNWQQSKPFRLDFLFAAADSKNSDRPRLTVTPLHDAHPEVPFDVSVPDAKYSELVGRLKQDLYDNSGVLICWHHGEILDFANALLAAGNGPPPVLPPAATWPTEKPPCNVFGWVYQIVYDATGAPTADWVRCFNEGLMSDDTELPPG
jgi:hypothetical protein